MSSLSYKKLQRAALMHANQFLRSEVERLEAALKASNKKYDELRVRGFEDKPGWRERLRESALTTRQTVSIDVDDLLEALYRITMLEAETRGVPVLEDVASKAIAKMISRMM